MRIVIDMQGAQTESRYRGIGRYTMEFAKAVVRNRGEHEVILALSGLFPDTIEPIRAAFEGLLPQENIRVWHAPGPVRDEEPENAQRREVAELVREAFLASLCPDVLHICSLFEGYVDDAVTSIGRLDQQILVSVTLYDLIPLLSPKQYMDPNPTYAAYYQRKLDSLKKASLFVAISESSRQEVINCLGVSVEQTINASIGVDQKFSPVEISETQKAQLLGKFTISHPFVLYTGGCDERKNLPRLIEAWSRLPATLRNAHQLVFSGRMPDGNVSELRTIARRFGLKDSELIFTGYVTDKELVQLYSLCKLFVFPSWHEGFGLPALEAMACGAPVISANTTSLPEVIGRQDALFDPLSIEDIREKLISVLNSESILENLRLHGINQSQQFSWDRTATCSLSAWEIHIEKNQSAKNTLTWKEISEQYERIYQLLVEKLARKISDSRRASGNFIKKLADCLARNEKEALGYHRITKLPSKIKWRLEGPFDSSYSIALVNRELASAISNLGHSVVLHSTEGPGDFDPDENFLKANPDLAEMHAASKDSPPQNADVLSRNLYPPRVEGMGGQLNLLHAYAWEESGFPFEWVENFNAYLQGITVTSNHVRKILIDHGVTTPIEVISNGVDHWERIISDASFRVEAKAFRFLHVSSCFPRKGVDIMLQAFGRAFRSNDDVSLIIKTFANPHNEIHQWIADARKHAPDFPDIKIIDTDLTDSQLKSLYEQCHVLVAPSRAEGFGLPMAEAMLTGLPVITTSWGGQTDFCTSNTAWLVDYSFQRAKTHFGIFSSVWAEPDVEHLAQLMKQLFVSDEHQRKARTEVGRELLLERFRWKHSAQRAINAAREWSKGSRQGKINVGWISSWNCKCGIAIYSDHLIKNMPEEIKIFAAHSNDLTGADDSRVVRCWNQGDNDKLEELSKSIVNARVNILVIQFNYAFFCFEVFSEFIFEQIRAGRKIVVTLHSTTDPKHAPRKELARLVPALSRCARILVHSVNDLNRLKSIGLVDNVTLFPHGVLRCENRGQKKLKNGKFVVGSYGFFLPHKGLPELIEAVYLLRNRGLDIQLEMINAEYPVLESKAMIEKARKFIADRGMSQYINLCHDFLPLEDSIQRLSNCDLIVFPYQETGESSSAAVRDGIASGRAVAVTPLEIFDDVSGAVHVLPGTSVVEIADGIQEISEEIQSESACAKKIEEGSKRWLDQLNYAKIGSRMSGMLSALMW